MKHKYVAQKGSQFTNKDAQVIGPELEKINSRGVGQLTPQAVLQEARSNRSPIHRFFQWDDTVAAEQFRLQQARHLLSHVNVVIETPKGERIIEGFVNVTTSIGDDDVRHYVNIVQAMGSESYRQQAINEAVSKVELWQMKYKDYRELGPIFSGIKAVKVRLRKVAS